MAKTVLLNEVVDEIYNDILKKECNFITREDVIDEINRYHKNHPHECYFKGDSVYFFKKTLAANTIARTLLDSYGYDILISIRDFINKQYSFRLPCSLNDIRSRLLICTKNVYFDEQQSRVYKRCTCTCFDILNYLYPKLFGETGDFNDDTFKALANKVKEDIDIYKEKDMPHPTVVVLGGIIGAGISRDVKNTPIITGNDRGLVNLVRRNFPEINLSDNDISMVIVCILNAILNVATEEYGMSFSSVKLTLTLEDGSELVPDINRILSKITGTTNVNRNNKDSEVYCKSDDSLFASTRFGAFILNLISSDNLFKIMNKDEKRRFILLSLLNGQSVDYISIKCSWNIDDIRTIVFDLLGVVEYNNEYELLELCSDDTKYLRDYILMCYGNDKEHSIEMLSKMLGIDSKIIKLILNSHIGGMTSGIKEL